MNPTDNLRAYLTHPTLPAGATLKLTDEESAVLGHLAYGYNEAITADELGIDKKKVKQVLATACEKNDIDNGRWLLHQYKIQRNGYIPPSETKRGDAVGRKSVWTDVLTKEKMYDLIDRMAEAEVSTYGWLCKKENSGLHRDIAWTTLREYFLRYGIDYEKEIDEGLLRHSASQPPVRAVVPSPVVGGKPMIKVSPAVVQTTEAKEVLANLQQFLASLNGSVKTDGLTMTVELSGKFEVRL